MWRNHYKFLWREKNDQLLLLSSRSNDELRAFPPWGENWMESTKYLIELTKELKLTIKFERIPEEMLSIFNQNHYNAKIIEDRNSWDYIYNQSDLADLPGKEYANERKKLNKIIRSNNWQYISLTAQNIQHCIDLQEKWCQARDCEENTQLGQENLAIQDLFQHYNDLQYLGGILEIDGKIQAYTLADKLSADTMVIHVEKANQEIMGTYQTINQQFVLNSAQNFRFINREQDLGIPSLRYSKINYHPVKMVKKFIVEINSTV
jgi:hypothetical protein